MAWERMITIRYNWVYEEVRLQFSESFKNDIALTRVDCLNDIIHDLEQERERISQLPLQQRRG